MGALLVGEEMRIKRCEGDAGFDRCHYFEKNRVFKANLMLMHNEAWDNIEEILRDFGIRIKRNNWGDSENDGRGKIP